MDKNYLDWNKFIKFESGLNCTTHQLNYLNTLEKLLHQAVFKTVGAQTRERRVRWWKKMTLCLVKSEKNRIVIWSYYYMVFWSSIVQITANSSSLWYFISWCWLGATFPRGFCRVCWHQDDDLRLALIRACRQVAYDRPGKFSEHAALLLP